ncbi:MAG: EAL domain-containing protein [Hyphomicrobiales bacterium]
MSVALALAVAAAWLFQARTAVLLREDALATARLWSQFIVRATPELLPVLSGDEPAISTIVSYRRAQELSHIGTFELYDDKGAPRLAFDGGQFAQFSSARPSLSAEAMETARQGPAIVEADSDGPTVIAPVVMAGKVIGFLRAVVNQQELKAAYAEHTQRLLLWLGAASLLIVVLFRWGGWRILRGPERPADSGLHLDRLTGLPDRAYLLEAIEKQLSRHLTHSGQVAVLAVDVDKFMEINSLLGNDGGDHVLRTVARRIADVAHGEIVARLAGDAFGVVIGRADVEEEAQRLGEAIVRAAALPIEWEDLRVTPTLSVGAAIAPTDGREGAVLMRHADLARVTAKDAGGNRLNFFNEGMGRQYAERLALDRTIEAALKAENFRLEYQPVVDLSSGRTVGFEALLRLFDDAGSPISPSLFIPAAERSGAIVPMGLWAVKRACAFAADWPAPLYVAVNLSPVQLEQDDIVADIAAALDQTGLPAHRLEIEVTESVLLGDSMAIRDRLDSLHRLGVRIVLDDFGSGYSSLSYLWRFPFDKIKIDQSFVRAMSRNRQARGVLRSIIAMGRTLGLPVTVEGIETDAESAFLKRLRCDYAQGFLFGRPLSEADVPALLLREFQRGPAPRVVQLDEPKSATKPAVRTG